MSDDKPEAPPRIGQPFARILLEPLNHGFATAERVALKHGVPAEAVIEMVLNHLCSLVAMVEPAGAREETLKSVVASFAPMVRQHYQARHTTPGGIITRPDAVPNGEMK